MGEGGGRRQLSSVFACVCVSMTGNNSTIGTAVLSRQGCNCQALVATVETRAGEPAGTKGRMTQFYVSLAHTESYQSPSLSLSVSNSYHATMHPLRSSPPPKPTKRATHVNARKASFGAPQRAIPIPLSPPLGLPSSPLPIPPFITRAHRASDCEEIAPRSLSSPRWTDSPSVTPPPSSPFLPCSLPCGAASVATRSTGDRCRRRRCWAGTRWAVDSPPPLVPRADDAPMMGSVSGKAKRSPPLRGGGGRGWGLQRGGLSRAVG